MIRVTGRLICTTPEDADIVTRRLPDHIRLSRAEPGCLSFNVTRSADPLVWQLDETFASRAAFDAHQTSASAWFAATAHLARDFWVQETPGAFSAAPSDAPRSQ
ncbi:antibiotic biosynthesis monooxygenase [Tabrizicola sp.]|uniref:putative quinol monooxygenase n=1 Tax=Tabrizicola sp. TaxID=2005166 RepID=UPI00286BA3A6|nr:antibiotic biosynthesis monooxygenase [Tabrizicola sp.]